MPADAVTGTVYFVDCGSLTKIGFTAEQDWRRRLDGIRTCNPFPLTPWATLPGNVAVERQIHDALAHFRRHLEWFDLSGQGRKAALAIIRSKNGQRLGDNNDA